MTPFQVYLRTIGANLSRGNATEHTHRPALKTLIESLEPAIIATNEPKRETCGAPDFILTKGHVPIGYIEAKDVGKSLDEVERGEQLDRYRESLGNLILTDYLEFRWYVGGEHRLTARLAGPGLPLKESEERTHEVAQLLVQFLETQTPTVGSSKELAKRMAHIARLIREIISRALGDEDTTGSLHSQMEGFRLSLLPDLTEEQFADMYAQTICYGLFAAKCSTSDGGRFNRLQAADDLPKTNPFLRKMSQQIWGYDLDDRLVWAVEDLVQLLARADMEAILRDFGKDPVVHFYETFLAEYDPKMREARGVYYTPEPVVSYIVRSVDHILRTDFGLPDGLADCSKVRIPTSDGEGVHKVQILDPATGTGTFLHGVIDRIHESHTGNQGMWSAYVREHLLPRVFGFELLMAPYAVAHMKLGLQLQNTGYDFRAAERLEVYLTNTLEEAFRAVGPNLFAQQIVEEANSASKVKRDTPVMVVLGNPPYSGHSANRSWVMEDKKRVPTFIGKLIRDYYEVDGAPLGEKNPKWLQDDYVKFIRFAQWRIDRTGHGVLAFITNHGYLDNPTFRGMRQSLMKSFDDIYILDLHGNSKKKEKAPDGGEDKNVFDIQQGVAIGIFVKRADAGNRPAKVKHAHLWGPREKKYEWLGEKNVARTDWTELTPSASSYMFVPQDDDLRSEYEAGCKVSEAVRLCSLGLNSHRDHFAVDFDRNVLINRVERFLDAATDAECYDRFGLTRNSDWSVEQSRNCLRSTPGWRGDVIKCLYRPFDFRYCLLSECVMDRPRLDLNCHAKQQNCSLVITRQTREPFAALMTDVVCGQHKIVAAYDGSYIVPLYLYPTVGRTASLFDEDGPSDAPGDRKLNLSTEFIADFSSKLGLTFIPDGKGDRGKTFGPEDVFSYMYAVFHSPTYRTRYAEFLKIDFPRLPLTSSPALFRELCALGNELVGLHLMEKRGTKPPGYPIKGDNIMENVRYVDLAPGRVWINNTQYFDGVPPEVWNFHVGGYQVCRKWLIDRKGRTLTYDDLSHYQGIVAALGDTIRIMGRIDEVIAAHGGFPIS
ncbi:MAG: N-6 DNA methylase [Armatimonadetes bacterium]|nr:N-6 DNA methylase [Armatimonadota bacterium]